MTPRGTSDILYRRALCRRLPAVRTDFTIPVAVAGSRQIHVAFAMTPRSGKVAFYLDGRPLQLADKADTIDLRCPHGTLLRSIALMPAELRAGNCLLTIQAADAPDSADRPEIGVDFIWVQEK